MNGKRSAGIGPAVLRYFQQHPGVTIHLPDLAKELGYPEDRIQSAVNSIRNRNTDGAGDAIDIIMAGNAWRWHPNGPARALPTKRMFEEIGPAKTGGIVIQDTDGNLFLAREL